VPEVRRVEGCRGVSFESANGRRTQLVVSCVS
jgi:hypothetical protein